MGLHNMGLENLQLMLSTHVRQISIFDIQLNYFYKASILYTDVVK